MFDPRRIVELVVLIHPSVHLKIKKKRKKSCLVRTGDHQFFRGGGRFEERVVTLSTIQTIFI